MDFLSLSFFPFIIFFLVCYNFIPTKYRYILIMIASYFFYGFADARMLLVLMMITVVSYIGGLIIDKKNNCITYAIFFALVVLALIVFKYSNFIIENINYVKLLFCGKGTDEGSRINIMLPIGLSFIVFQVCTYLGDVHRNKMKVEKNFIKYAAFVAFFPTVLAGPIQKARNLIPQISNPLKFDSEMAKKGTIIFVWGAFEKIMVANRLLVIVNKVFNDYVSYDSAYYLVATVCFSLYIYADFSSYSDMARGIAMLMGINVGKNFNNPYLSCSTSEFWNRWHMSLNSWFIEYVYIPLGGNRRGVVRKYINIFIVFLISGLWHGANYHYVVWGIINGLFVIIGEVVLPIKSKVYKLLNVDERTDSIIYLRRAIVFILISFTWVFFYNNISNSLYIIKRMILFNPINFFDENLLSISGSVIATFATLLYTFIFAFVQLKRQHETEEYMRFSKQPLLFQAVVIGLIICICIFGACATDANVNSQFLYFQF